MEESGVFAPVDQEEIRADIGALFRGSIRVTLEYKRCRFPTAPTGRGGGPPNLRRTGLEPTCHATNPGEMLLNRPGPLPLKTGSLAAFQRSVTLARLIRMA
jgi:hypothetical protein